MTELYLAGFKKMLRKDVGDQAAVKLIKEKRREFRSLVLAAILVLALPLTMTFGQPVESVFLTVDTKSGTLDVEEGRALQQQLQPVRGSRFWQIDIRELQQDIKSLDWIRSVRVAKRWPNVLTLDLIIEVPVARWNEDGFLNAQGEPIHSLNPPLQLPVIESPASFSKMAMELLLSARSRFGDISLLQMDNRGEVRITLASGLKINLGAESFQTRFARVQRLLEEVQISGSWGSVDTRYTGGLAVSWLDRTGLTINRSAEF